jgi:hypothetical protein
LLVHTVRVAEVIKMETPVVIPRLIQPRSLRLVVGMGLDRVLEAVVHFLEQVLLVVLVVVVVMVLSLQPLGLAEAAQGAIPARVVMVNG